MKKIGLLWKSFRRGCQNCILRVLWNVLRKNILFAKIIIFLIFSNFQHKIFCRVVTTACYMSRAAFWRKMHFLMKALNSNCFRTLSKFFSHCHWNFLSALCKLHSRCPVKNFGETICCLRHFSFLQSFFALRAKTFRRTISENFSPGLSKQHSRCPEKHFGENIFFESKIGFLDGFFALWDETLWTFGEIFRQGCQNCLLRVQGNFLRKMFNWKDNTFLVSRTSNTRIFAELSKLHATFPEKYFEEKGFFRWKVNFIIFLALWARIFFTVSAKSSSALVTTAFEVSSGTFWKKKCFLREKLDFYQVFLRILRSNLLDFYGKPFVRVVKTALYVPTKTFW